VRKKGAGRRQEGREERMEGKIEAPEKQKPWVEVGISERRARKGTVERKIN
jgi:hypothetical protein